jgi:DNA adenine methylase
MRTRRPYNTYNGGKNGSGVYQAIINQIPPHDVFISAFAGNCGVMANKKPAPMANICIDTDATVIKDWNNIEDIIAVNADCMEWLPAYLKSVQDHTKVFIFVDPPYLLDSRKSKAKLYKNEMTDLATHKKLLRYLNTLQVNVLVSHYPSPVYDKYLKNWFTKDIVGRSRSGMTVERLYMNYQTPKDYLHEYTYLGENYREREAFKLMKKSFAFKFKRMKPMHRAALMELLKEIQTNTHATTN